MSIKIINHDIYLEISKDKSLLLISFDCNGIEIFSNIILKLSNMSEKYIDASSVLSVNTEKNEYIPVHNIIIHKEEFGDSEHIIALNYTEMDKAIHMYLNKSGISDVYGELTLLNSRLKKGVPENIIYMVDDYGGSFLADIALIRDSYVIKVLKFCGWAPILT